MKRARSSNGFSNVVKEQPVGHKPGGPAFHQTAVGKTTAGTRYREWLVRCGLLVGAPLLLLVSVETGLRLFGYGYPVQFFVKSASGQKYITNEKFAWQFSSKKTPLKPFPASVPLQKAPDTLRICVLGESAAMGTPDPAFGLGRILEVLLRRKFPERHFEIINAAMRGINSHAIRVIARECADHQVDVFLVYMGNNEVVGLHGPAPGDSGWAQSLPLIRCSHWFTSSKTGQLFDELLGGSGDRASQDMEYFRAHSLRADDWRRDKAREIFRANLEDILRAATRSGAKVILSTVAVNLKDFAPLESLHRVGLTPEEQLRWESAYKQGAELAGKGQWPQALEKYSEAAAIDDHFAELQFRLAEAWAAAGDNAKAKEHYLSALDWDALQFRTDTRMNEVIRQSAGRYAASGVILLDSAQAFAAIDLSSHGIPGAQLFEDHVHPTFSGNYLLACQFYAQLVSALGPSLGKPASVLPDQAECADALAYTLYDELNVKAAMVRMTGSPPFFDQLNHAERQSAAEAVSRKRLASFNVGDAERCLAKYSAAIHQRPDDWVLHFNLALFFRELKRPSEAAKELSLVVEQFPEFKGFRLALASALEDAGQRDLGLIQLQEALRLDPRDPEIAQARREFQSRRLR